MTRATRGPWVATECHGTFYIFGGRDGQAMVADGETEEAWLARIRGVGRGATVAEQAANASLIAAAPDLLAAAKSVRATCPADPDINPDPDINWNAAWDALVAAIAKAEEQPS